jgi:hypothetical protein
LAAKSVVPVIRLIEALVESAAHNQPVRIAEGS